jgi:hypothetical protein
MPQKTAGQTNMRAHGDVARPHGTQRYPEKEIGFVQVAAILILRRIHNANHQQVSL